MTNSSRTSTHAHSKPSNTLLNVQSNTQTNTYSTAHLNAHSNTHSKPSILNYLQKNLLNQKNGKTGFERIEERSSNKTVDNVSLITNSTASLKNNHESTSYQSSEKSFRPNQKRTYQSTDFEADNNHDYGRGKNQMTARPINSHPYPPNQSFNRGRGRGDSRGGRDGRGSMHSTIQNPANSASISNNHTRFSADDKPISQYNSNQVDVSNNSASIINKHTRFPDKEKSIALHNSNQVKEHRQVNEERQKESDPIRNYFSSDEEDVVALPVSHKDIVRKIEQYNSKLIVVTSSIASLTRERSGLMKKIQQCEHMLSSVPPSVEKTPSHQAMIMQPPPRVSPSVKATESQGNSRTLTHTPTTSVTVPSIELESNTTYIISGQQIPFNPFISGRNWTLESCPNMQVIKSVQTEKLCKLNRKPRNLVLYPSHQFNQSHASLQDMAIIPTVSNDIQVYNLRKQIEMPCISKKTIFTSGTGWAEECSWVSPDTLAISLHNSRPAGSNVDLSAPETGLTLLRNCNIDRNGKFQYDISQFEKSPHSKMILAMEHIQCESSSRFKFATGGADKAVHLWNVDDSALQKSFRNSHEPSCTFLHNIHSSEVTCLYYDKTSSVLYSGGKDYRVIGFDVEKNQRSYGGKEIRNEFMLREILPVSTQPKLLVIGGYQKMNTCTTFNIFDIRMQQYVLKVSRGPSTGAYNRASIHKNGMLITAGDVSNCIQIWDLRYVKVNCEYQKLENIHAKSVVTARFYETDFIRSSILSVGSDNEMNLTDYERGR